MTKNEKIEKELIKAREKAAEWQARIQDLEKQKQEEENSMIVQAVRSLKLTPAELLAFLDNPTFPPRAKLARSPILQRRIPSMKNKLFRRAAVLTATLLSLTCMSVTAYAQSDEPTEEPAPEVMEETTAKPFTPDRTGTVVDNATDEDGKEFFTITTPSENVFYLVIDRQRTEQNVYFLNAVTEKDLLALAEAGPEPEVTETVTETEPTPEPVTEPEPEPEKEAGFPVGNLLMIAAVLLVGSGVGYYFKVYRPKHEAPDLDEDEYDYEAEADPYGDMEEIEETEDEE